MNIARKTTLEVVKQAQSVKINREKIVEIAERWAKEKIGIPPRQKEDILNTRDKRKMLDYLIILDTTNFCFWPSFARGTKRRIEKEKWNIKYKGKRISGYYAFSVAWKKFFEKNPQKANFENFYRISFNDFSDIFKGSGELQFLRKRWQMVRAVSKVFVKKYGGDSYEFIKAVKHKFSFLVPKIYQELPFFNDVAVYNGKKTYLLKRAQILACDICFAFKNKGIGHFKDLDYLTAMADYKLPQILRYWGVLEYSKKLENKIKKKTLIPAGSKEEIEIRSATIWAVEYLCDELSKRGRNFSAFEIDWILWNMSQKEKRREPYHLTKSIYY